jgi:hypothetical protein
MSTQIAAARGLCSGSAAVWRGPIQGLIQPLGLADVEHILALGSRHTAQQVTVGAEPSKTDWGQGACDRVIVRDHKIDLEGDVALSN